jgi:hypothetical protein
MVADGRCCLWPGLYPTDRGWRRLVLDERGHVGGRSARPANCPETAAAVRIPNTKLSASSANVTNLLLCAVSWSAPVRTLLCWLLQAHQARTSLGLGGPEPKNRWACPSVHSVASRELADRSWES